MQLKQNMKFDITNKFIPNFCQAKSLKITNVNASSVMIEMENAKSRGVFPLSQFQSLVRDGALIAIENSKEDTA